MIDPQLLRDNPGSLRLSQQLRGSSVSLVDDAIAADAQRRTTIQEFEKLRAQQNAFGRTVATAPKEAKRALVLQAQALAAQVKQAQQQSADAEAEFAKIVGAIANVTIGSRMATSARMVSSSWLGAIGPLPTVPT